MIDVGLIGFGLAGRAFHAQVIRAVPGPFHDRKPPVDLWIHELYAKKFGAVLTEEPPAPVESLPPFPDTLPRNSCWPWPDDPEMPEPPGYHFD